MAIQWKGVFPAVTTKLKPDSRWTPTPSAPGWNA